MENATREKRKDSSSSGEESSFDETDDDIIESGFDLNEDNRRLVRAAKAASLCDLDCDVQEILSRIVHASPDCLEERIKQSGLKLTIYTAILARRARTLENDSPSLYRRTTRSCEHVSYS